MKKYYLNNDFKFNNSYDESYLKEYHPEFKDVRIPHSVVETEFNYFDESVYQMISTYQRIINIPMDLKGQYIEIVFEAAAHYAKVYLNGELLVEHESGYTAFKADISDKVKFNEDNLLTVVLDSNESLNIPPFGKVIDYMTYGGIYRDVYLNVGNRKHIEDVFVTTDIKNGIRINLDMKLSDESLDTRTFIKDLDGNVIYESTLNERSMKLNDVELWSPANPVLYYVETQLLENGEVVDEYIVKTGFRTIDFKADGLYVNDNKTKFMGLDRHQSFPYVGYAMPESMQRNDARIMKYELGLNAVRTSHYPQSHYFLDECDKLGLLVFTEIPGWQHIGDDYWKNVVLKNTEEMVKQYRNHPSIFLWGVRINESADDDELYIKTNEIAHNLDSSRPTSGVRYIQKSSLKEDVYAYNEFIHSGENEGVLDPKKNSPDMNKGYLISEYCGHMYPTKTFDDEKHRTQLFKRHARILNDAASYDKIAGTFGWCFFDYNTHKDFGSGDRICYHGVCDMFRNPKGVAEVYRAQGLKENVLYVTSGMDIGDSAGGVIEEIYAITNADSIKLYKNDQFVKEYKQADSIFTSLKHGPILIDDRIGELIERNEGFPLKQANDVRDLLLAANKYGMSNLPLKYKLIAAKCILIYKMKMEQAVDLYGKYISGWGDKVTTWKFEAIKDGDVVGEVIKTPMKEIVLDVKTSGNILKEGISYDVGAIRIRTLDDNGNVLPYLNEPISFKAEGAIEIIGPSLSALRGGMGGTYVKTKGSGKGKLTIEALGKHIEEEFEVIGEQYDQM